MSDLTSILNQSIGKVALGDQKNMVFSGSTVTSGRAKCVVTSIGMNTEVVLFYSERFFGTADAICFRDGVLRIHDLKTGNTKVKIEQLEVYAALFCLEYQIKPTKIEFELRIYQNDEVLYANPTPEKIQETMDTIVHLDKLLQKAEYEGV